MLRIKEDKAVADLEERLEAVLDYSIALQRAIECHCQGEEVRPHIAEKCDHHAQMLNKSLRGHAGADTADIPALTCRIDTLEIERAGNDRTFRELIRDNAELMCRVEELDEAALELARHIKALAERIEQPERLLEKEEGLLATCRGILRMCEVCKQSPAIYECKCGLFICWWCILRDGDQPICPHCHSNAKPVS